MGHEAISKVRSHRSIVLAGPVAVALALFLAGVVAADFERVVIDKNIGGRTAIGDIDGDGFNDIVVHTWSSDRGKQNDGKVGWYKYPGWRRYSIVDSGHIFGDGVLAVDLDQDGDNDVVTAKGSDNEASVVWYENPGGAAVSGWKEHKLATVETSSETMTPYAPQAIAMGTIVTANRARSTTKYSIWARVLPSALTASPAGPTMP